MSVRVARRARPVARGFEMGPRRSSMAALVIVSSAAIAMSCDDGDGDPGGCQDQAAYCQLVCSLEAECMGGSPDPSCVSSCRDAAVEGGYANLLHDCMISQGCAFFSDTSCVNGGLAGAVHTCPAPATSEVCDVDGCCGEMDCARYCARRGASAGVCNPAGLWDTDCTCSY